MKIKKRKTTRSDVKEIKKSLSKIPDKEDISFDKYVSTGSTLLDLAISSGRIYEGGVPGGILMEIFGPPGSGKTAVLAELCASAQARGGSIRFLDPEGRLDQEYCRIYGMNLPREEYFMPDTVEEMFNLLQKWKPKTDGINVLATDSLAALSTELELEKGDKMGMKRAKDFSQGLRKTCRVIRNNNWIVAASNQVRQSDMGEVTPGGKGIPFYASLRIRIQQVKTIPISKKVREKKIDKIIGIESKCFIKKSTVDDPFREVPVFIIFGFGIDDVRGNLQWYKDITGETTYDCVDENYKSMNHAIQYIEKNNLQKKLKKRTVELWYEIEDKFKINRKSKVRE